MKHRSSTDGLTPRERWAEIHARARLICFNAFVTVFILLVLYFIWTIISAAEPILTAANS